MKLRIYKEVSVRLPRQRISSLFSLIVDEEAEPDSRATVHLVFTDDVQLQQLNREFRAKDTPTDVLSFNLDNTSEAGAVFGEIYISVPTAIRQAESYGAGNAEELLRLTCHGLLHLFGYDHLTAAEADDMKARESRFLEQAART